MCIVKALRENLNLPYFSSTFVGNGIDVTGGGLGPQVPDAAVCLHVASRWETLLQTRPRSLHASAERGPSMKRRQQAMARRLL